MSDKKPADTVGDYYRRQAEKAERISKAIEDAKLNGAPSWIIQRLRDELEDARYVGD